MCRKSQKKWVEAIEVFTDLAAKVPSGELAEKVNLPLGGLRVTA